ncbi:hypothetical protein BKA82DRAFT_1003205 [Pisolithus tinctorius]|uniref:Uncharacterized protein n=1 Tax=Pisolithus tinctorius Marx 270 TaxID=870435 RepID=A0A0C3IWR7_PISTI|nr:hypothetical protein BKA82DRAFT_1003205 [Pisolithus tinctorius]KIO01273.1 hypothetical protein M404DRAFT_1003205 [Pisolithus tinctorius Marx 270]
MSASQFASRLIGRTLPTPCRLYTPQPAVRICTETRIIAYGVPSLRRASSQKVADPESAPRNQMSGSQLPL